MYSSLTKWVLTLLLIGAAIAAPALNGRQGTACASLKKRRSWHTLSDTEKKAYLDAEVCLMGKPATLGLRGARTRFDELQSIHVFQSEIAHFVGTFFPFHRLYLHAHEKLLETECNYSGGQPYWNESIDTGRFSQSIILDPDVGFGGSGVGQNNCIQDGPFASYVNSLGPGYTISDHCIQRQVNDRFSGSAAQSQVDACMKLTTYVEFWRCVEGGPHGAGHGGIGAQMLNPISSPGDPLFYLHHAWLDGMWARWQDAAPASRLTDMGGNNKMSLGGAFGGGGTTGGGFPGGGGGGGGGFGFPGRPSDVPEPQVIGDPGNVTTLSHLIEMYGIVPNRTVGDVMDTRGVLCYEYD